MGRESVNRNFEAVFGKQCIEDHFSCASKNLHVLFYVIEPKAIVYRATTKWRHAHTIWAQVASSLPNFLTCKNDDGGFWRLSYSKAHGHYVNLHGPASLVTKNARTDSNLQSKCLRVLHRKDFTLVLEGLDSFWVRSATWVCLKGSAQETATESHTLWHGTTVDRILRAAVPRYMQCRCIRDLRTLVFSQRYRDSCSFAKTPWFSINLQNEQILLYSNSLNRSTGSKSFWGNFEEADAMVENQSRISIWNGQLIITILNAQLTP